MKKLIKDQKENFHATSKIMRKVREEKNLQKKAERELKLERKYARFDKLHVVFLLLLSYAALVLTACGTLNKQVSKDKSAITVESNMEETRLASFSEANQQWLESWMKQWQFTSASIYSDSTIKYQPEEGFSMAKGALVFTQLSKQQSKLEESAASNELSTIHAESKQKDLMDSQKNSVRSEKERHPPNLMIWVGIAVLISVLLWDWNHKRLKRQ